MTTCYWLQALPPNSSSFWLLPNIWTLATPVAAVVVAWLTYRYAVKKMHKETIVQLQRLKYERKLQALEGCWKLLLHTTEVENGQHILTWQRTGGVTTWYLNKAQADHFIKALAMYFYGSGLGIYLPATIKEPLFTYRNVLYGFLLREQQNTATEVQVQNEQLVDQLKSLHALLIQELKKETEWIEKTTTD
jgi:hypothetical protein